MPAENLNFEEILRVLTRFEVDFIVVGGLCAVMHGAPIHTYHLDIVPSREPDNLERLVRALTELDAFYREHPRTRLRPFAERMTGPGHHLLSTTSGPVDVLGAIARGRDYATLLPHTIRLELDDMTWVRILDLRTLIATKQETGRDKDKLMLPILQRTLDERNRPEKE